MKKKYFTEEERKTAKRISNKKWEEANPDKVIKSKRKHYEENKEKILNKQKEDYIKNPEKRRNYGRDYYEKNKEIVNLKRKEQRKLNSEKIKEQNRLYRKINSEKIKERRKKDRIKQRNKNPHIVAWRAILKDSLRRMGNKKEISTIKSLGYSAQQLKQRIECQFTDGMSWDNYGEWHIDHKKEIRNFNKDTKPSTVNALCNLRPLWKTSRVINGVFYEGNLNRRKS